jgi:hypothetical protein
MMSMLRKNSASYPGVDHETTLDDKVIDKLFIKEGNIFLGSISRIV